MIDSQAVNLTTLFELASFSVADIAGDNTKKKIAFFYHDPERQYTSLMVVIFPLGRPPIPPIECEMHYSSVEKRWVATVDRHNDAREKFFIICNVKPAMERALKEKAPILQEGYIALKNGIQQPVNKTPGIAQGKLDTFLYTEQGEIKTAVQPSELKEGDRLMTVYFPPGYDSQRTIPYNFQITLDGGQYLQQMHMDAIFDNLIAKGEIEPVVNVFISPYTGAPHQEKLGYFNVAPKGYSLEMRFKEYSCNPEFSRKLSNLPNMMRAQGFNITDNSEHTTICGLSMGGLQAEYTALLYPNIFGNIIAQSPMAWNIPTQHQGDWREQITDDWKTSSALLPPAEKHDEHVTTMVREEFDIISGQAIKPPKPLRFYFDAGSDEARYEVEGGFANLVKSTELFANALEEKGHKVVARLVSPGGHDEMTWMGNIPDAAKMMHAPRMQPVQNFNQASKGLFFSHTATQFSQPANNADMEAHADISAEDMANKTAFGAGTNTAKQLKASCKN